MAYCSNCGQQLSENMHFCFNCGATVNNTANQSNQRRTIYDGIVHKCIRCGEVINAFAVQCPACGYELRGAKTSSVVKELAAKLEKMSSIPERCDLIRNFYIPNTKEDIFEFHEHSQGTTITLTFQMEDEPGLLSDVLRIVAEFGANILTIHQSIPINGVASLSLSVQVLPTTGNVSEMLEELEKHNGVRNVKILGEMASMPE